MGWIKKGITAAIVFLPLITYYKAPVLVSDLSTLIVIVLLLVILCLVCIKPKGISLRGGIKEHGILILWVIFITLVMGLVAPYETLSGSNLNGFLFLIILLIVLSFGLSGIFDFPFGIRLYSVTTIILTVFLAAQIVAFYFLRLPLDLQLPFLQLDQMYDYAFHRLSYRVGADSARFQSLFSEPAHYAQYVVPYLCMRLFGYRDYVKPGLPQAVGLTVLIVVAASGVGIVAVAIIWAIYFGTVGRRLATKALSIALGILILCVSYTCIKSFDATSEVLGRLFVSSGDVSTKADYRVYRGFVVFANLPVGNMIVGTGFNNAESAMRHHSISTRYDRPGVLVEYFNGVAQILIYSGIIGFLLYWLMLIRMYNNSDSGGRALVIVFFALCMSGSIFMGATWSLYMLLIVAGTKCGNQAQISGASRRFPAGGNYKTEYA